MRDCTVACLALLALITAQPVAADTLEMVDGTLIEASLRAPLTIR